MSKKNDAFGMLFTRSDGSRLFAFAVSISPYRKALASESGKETVFSTDHKRPGGIFRSIVIWSNLSVIKVGCQARLLVEGIEFTAVPRRLFGTTCNNFFSSHLRKSARIGLDFFCRSMYICSGDIFILPPLLFDRVNLPGYSSMRHPHSLLAPFAFLSGPPETCDVHEHADMINIRQPVDKIIAGIAVRLHDTRIITLINRASCKKIVLQEAQSYSII